MNQQTKSTWDVDGHGGVTSDSHYLELFETSSQWPAWCTKRNVFLDTISITIRVIQGCGLCSDVSWPAFRHNKPSRKTRKLSSQVLPIATCSRTIFLLAALKPSICSWLLGLSEVILNEGQGCQHLNIVRLSCHSLHLLGSFRNTLAHNALAFLLGLLLLLVILLDSLQECFVASRLAHVLNADMDALAQLAVAHNLGHLNSQGVAVHVEDNSSPAMVERVWQSLLDGGVRNNVHIVSTLEVHQVPGQTRSSLGPVLLGILVTSAMSVTLRDHTCLSHGCSTSLAPCN